MLDKTVRTELSSLSREVAVQTGAHLAAANYFFESDPERAWEHSVAARKRGGRLGVVRETAGLAAYATGRYADALAELRTARRITGSNEYLPVMADAERGLGRPERALELARSQEAQTLDTDGRIELKIVESGARADLGEYDAAVVVLQIPELESSRRSPSLARLRFAYSEALKAAKRHSEAESWRTRAIAEDVDGSAGVNTLDDEDLEVIDLELGEDEFEVDEDGAEEVADLVEDDSDQGADSGEAADDDENLAEGDDVEDLADDELDDDLEDDEEDEFDDEDEEGDEEDDAADELIAQTDQPDSGPATDASADQEAGKEAGKETNPEANSAKGAKGSAFEVRFEHGGREDADRSTDRPE